MDELFKGIADPIRREVLDLLRQSPLNINQINDHFNHISRQAISKHLQILEETGWLKIYTAGRSRYGYLNQSAFFAFKEWVDSYLQWGKTTLTNDHGVFLDHTPYKKGAPLTQPVMLQALLSKDKTFDGVFYTAVKTTGIFCKPSCSANPRPDNVIFYESKDDALKNGYRACKRCKP